MITRLTSSAVCREVVGKYPEDFTFDIESWLAAPLNRAYESGQNIGFAEYRDADTYVVHLCFATARGRDAVKLGAEMLERLYDDTGATRAFASIRSNNKPACLVTRLVGFQSLGVSDGRELFIHTRSKWDS